jgi:hypothetical protein
MFPPSVFNYKLSSLKEEEKQGHMGVAVCVCIKLFNYSSINSSTSQLTYLLVIGGASFRKKLQIVARKFLDERVPGSDLSF